ncbi:MAG: bifunctional phosphoribosyl-AMP cyclohydrolase/phosphoribosyl-ATP diphosphatase HisIE [Dehalococcoidia bacterium]
MTKGGDEAMKMKLDEQGLIPAIAQDAETGQVLMLGYVSPSSLKRTLEGGEVWFYSRSRQELWHKGEVSGNFLRLREALVDCDGDALLLKVEPTGPACHTGERSCFFTPLKEMPQEFQRAEQGPGILGELFVVIQERQREMPQGSYTADLLRQGMPAIAQKVIEEAGEVTIAALQGDREHLPSEMADLVYHSLVLMAAAGVSPEQVWEELRQRRR